MDEMATRFHSNGGLARRDVACSTLRHVLNMLQQWKWPYVSIWPKMFASLRKTLPNKTLVGLLRGRCTLPGP